MKKLFLASMLIIAANFTPALFADTPSDVAFQPNLEKLDSGDGWKVVNRNVQLMTEKGVKIAHLDDNAGAGIAWVENYQFSNGVIEFDARGKNDFQKSFLGIAFHGVGDMQYEAVYFRPFNFMSDDSVRKNDAVQYIAPPTYAWQKIHTEYPHVYDQPVQPAPDPNGWFHVRIVVDGSKVSVYVNNSPKPSLEVARLSDVTNGMVGLWVGDNSGGDFAHLRIVPAQ
ncbi:MAG: family 16 glycoside hydrolase [Bacteroidota bacterium]